MESINQGGVEGFTESQKHFTNFIVNILDEINLRSKYFDLLTF
jgi:hypothetical protein